ncbi:MAG TPA: isochorismatase family protein [Isosphaeraceae bacterium]|nr:isochorismatase family protein [Isosphaeraceae bacterium]
MTGHVARVVCLLLPLALTTLVRAGEESTRIYQNRLKPVTDPRPILADFPQFVEPVHEVAARFEAPTLVDDPGADLEVRAWRFSYNARGIIEVPNRLRADRTAVIVVHPWGIDDGQGWRTPEPAGVAFQCTPVKNRLVLDHAATVINPFLKAMRDRVRLVAYSLPGTEDPIRKKLYRSIHGQPSAHDRKQGQKELEAKLASFPYRGQALPATVTVSAETPTLDYFQQFPGIDSGPGYEGRGFWELPIPVMKPIEVAPRDVVIYDAEGYPLLRDFLKREGVRHILLAGYNTDMCVCATTAGYKNLARDFDVFLLGDATIATFPAQPTPRYATNQAVCYAALNLFITQVSWVRPVPVPHGPERSDRPR